MRTRTITSASGIVVVEIDGGIKHHIHHGLLVRHSEYFNTALKGPWKEAEDGKVRLEHVQREPCKYPFAPERSSCVGPAFTVDIFVTWLYTQKIIAQSPSGKSGHDLINFANLNAIILCDRLLAPASTKAMQDHFIKTYTMDNRAASFDVVGYAHRNLRNDNPIVEMLADLHVNRYVEKVPSMVDADLEDEIKLPIKFLLKIMHKYAQKNDVAGQNTVYACGYIGHAATAGQQCLECSTATRAMLGYTSPLEMEEDEDIFPFESRCPYLSLIHI